MILDILVTLLAVATIGSYLWSVKFHFESGALEAGAKLISIMVITGAIVFTALTWALAQPPTIQFLGCLLQGLSLVLFWVTIRETRNAQLLAAFTDKNPGSLVTSGPYRFVRHPFYSSYLLFWFGWAVATANIWSLVLFAIMCVIYWRAAEQEEDKFKNTSMAEEYASFKAGRKRFIPFIL
ncbi:MAG: isoprenylcysteine carboxylmethyltransferase family protein [Pseudomonadota bacterium]